MSTSLVQNEIELFLKRDNPEVLCISGKWGVGKTFAWQKYLIQIVESKKLAMGYYSYVSLFGINSLEELRCSIVENTVDLSETIHDPDIITVDTQRRFVSKLFRKQRPLIEMATSILKVREVSDSLYRIAFLNLRKQVICFDDFERAGASLTSNDILGLASMLREQRECKIVFLMNEDALEEENKITFRNNLEKVVDTFIVFDPTCDEALDICIEDVDDVAAQLRKNVKLLNITNIRVIKKIEQWVRKVMSILSDSQPPVLEQAISTTVLAGWAILQPTQAPSIEFILSLRYWSPLSKKEGISDQERDWREILGGYGYRNTDELDTELIKSLTNGYFNAENILARAEILNSNIRLNQKSSSIESAWGFYWSNFDMDDESILEKLYESAAENIENISCMNINQIITILRQYGLDDRADEIVDSYIDKNKDTLYTSSQSPEELFYNSKHDEMLLEAIKSIEDQSLDERDPVERLKQLAEQSGFNPGEDVRIIAKMAKDDWLRLIYTPDRRIGKMLGWARRLADQPEPEAKILCSNLDAAVREVAQRSPMRRDRLCSWGAFPPNTQGS